MKRAKLTTSAKADLLDIFIYIATRSQSVQMGKRYIQRLRNHCHHLASLPFQMGIPRPELGLDMRSVAFENYVILFRYTANRLEVIDIVEGHRDIPEYFSVTNPE